MATIIQLVDTLIGDVLAGNVYSDKHTFKDVLAASKIPPSIQPQIEAAQENLKNNLYDNSSPDLFSARGGTHSLDGLPDSLRYFDIFATAHWLRNIGRETGVLPDFNGNRTSRAITKGVTFLASKFLLTFFNPGDPEVGGPLNQVFNPASLIVAGLPFVRGLTDIETPTLASVVGNYKLNTAPLVAVGAERLLLMRKGLYFKAPDGTGFSKGTFIPAPGFIGDLNGTSPVAGVPDSLEKNIRKQGLPSAFSTIEGQVDGTNPLSALQGLHTNLYTPERPYNQNNAIFPQDRMEAQFNAGDTAPQVTKLKDMFTAKPFPGGRGVTLESKQAYTFVANPRFFGDGFASPTNLDIDAAFPEEDPSTALRGTLIPENSIYLPFFFQDLRDQTEQFLYFRAFLKNDLNESFTPDWQTERYYGRVDQLPVYIGTTRNLNFSFDIVAWGPQDLPIIYKKLRKLQSMVYPTYDIQGFLKAGPILKIRIGDLIADEANKGLPGYMTSLVFDYDDGIWNISSDQKVPRKISVAVAFTVVHEGNPGIYPYTQKTITSDGGTVGGDSDVTFGAGKFTARQDGSTEVVVSEGNIRKIFDSQRLL